MVTHVGIGGAFWLDTAPAASFQRLQTKLVSAFGFEILLSTRPGLPGIGAGRTPAEEQQINPGGPRNSDHVLGRAIDINNHEQFRAINQEVFIAILESEGWVNVTVDGQPFPREPWHWARRGTIPADTSLTPLSNPTEQESDDVTSKIVKGDKGTPQYRLNLETLTRRWVPVEVWPNVFGGPVVVPQAELDGIPKEPGSIDFDGHTVGADGK